jgi:hypothetical protein
MRYVVFHLTKFQTWRFNKSKWRNTIGRSAGQTPSEADLEEGGGDAWRKGGVGGGDGGTEDEGWAGEELVEGSPAGDDSVSRRGGGELDAGEELGVGSPAGDGNVSRRGGRELDSGLGVGEGNPAEDDNVSERGGVPGREEFDGKGTDEEEGGRKTTGESEIDNWVEEDPGGEDPDEGGTVVDDTPGLVGEVTKVDDGVEETGIEGPDEGGTVVDGTPGVVGEVTTDGGVDDCVEETGGEGPDEGGTVVDGTPGEVTIDGGVDDCVEETGGEDPDEGGTVVDGTPGVVGEVTPGGGVGDCVEGGGGGGLGGGTVVDGLETDGCVEGFGGGVVDVEVGIFVVEDFDGEGLDIGDPGREGGVDDDLGFKTSPKLPDGIPFRMLVSCSRNVVEYSGHRGTNGEGGPNIFLRVEMAAPIRLTWERTSFSVGKLTVWFVLLTQWPALTLTFRACIGTKVGTNYQGQFSAHHYKTFSFRRTVTRNAGYLPFEVNGSVTQTNLCGICSRHDPKGGYQVWVNISPHNRRVRHGRYKNESGREETELQIHVPLLMEEVEPSCSLSIAWARVIGKKECGLQTWSCPARKKRKKRPSRINRQGRNSWFVEKEIPNWQSRRCALYMIIVMDAPFRKDHSPTSKCPEATWLITLKSTVSTESPCPCSIQVVPLWLHGPEVIDKENEQAHSRAPYPPVLSILSNLHRKFTVVGSLTLTNHFPSVINSQPNPDAPSLSLH